MEAIPEELKQAGLDHLGRVARRTILQFGLSDLSGASAEKAEKQVLGDREFLTEGERQKEDFKLVMATGESTPCKYTKFISGTRRTTQ